MMKTVQTYGGAFCPYCAELTLHLKISVQGDLRGSGTYVKCDHCGLETPAPVFGETHDNQT